MRNRSDMLDQACEAMMAGDPERCDEVLTQFRASVERWGLSEAERPICAAQLERLGKLAQSACAGIDSARAWLAELAEVSGGLDVYDRGGRQRVPTELVGRKKRF